MNENTRGKVISGDGETDLLTGVLQVDTFGPFLFVIVLDYAIKVAIGAKEKSSDFILKEGKV